MIHSLIKHFTRYSKAQADYTLTCPSCWIYDAKGFGEMMVKNKVKTPAKAKGVTQDVSPSATNMGSTSSYTLELTLPTVSSSTNSHHTNSTMPAAEAQSTPDPEQQSSPSGWEQCSPDAQSQWGAVADRVYVHAAAIFDHARNEKPGGLGVVRYGQKSESPPCSPPASSAQEQHQAYKLAFNSLKYQELLENVIIDSCLCRSQTLPDDLMGLVMVMLFDLMDRKFLPREPIRADKEDPMGEVKQVEACLLRFKTKLAASLARLRIKENLLTIADTLPDRVKIKDERAHTLPVHAWVNTFKSSIEEVCEQLQAVGFSEVESPTYGPGLLFWRDVHCSDVLVFPSHTKAQLVNSLLSRECILNIQGKSRSLAAWAVCPLLEGDSEVLMVGSFSALTVAHIAVLANARSARVLVCGVPPNSSQRKELQKLMSIMGCKNVRLLSESFVELDEWDVRMQKVRVVLLLPQCSTSALSNPVEHIITENGDRSLLQCLSRGAVTQSKLDTLTSKQTRDLSHALSFPKVHAVVYCTCSERAEENEVLVQRVLEKTETRPKLIQFRLIPPGLGCGSEQTSLRLEPSEFSNGCFLCVLAREPDPSKVESAQDVLARAVAKGLLEGFVAPLPTRKDKRRHHVKAPPMSLPPVLLEPVELAEPTSPPSPCPASATLSGDTTGRVVVLSSDVLQTTIPRRKHQHSKAPHHQHSHKKHTSKRSKGPAQHRALRGPRALSSKQGVLKPGQEVLLSGKELVTSKQEVMKPGQEVCLKDKVTSSHELQEQIRNPKQDVRSSKNRLTSVPDVLNFRQTISPGNKLVTSTHHTKTSRGGVISAGRRGSVSRQEEQRADQEKELIVSRHGVVKATCEIGKKEGRSTPSSRGQEAVRPVELVLPPLCLSQTRFPPSLSRLMSSSSQFSNSSISSRTSSVHWNT
ncbi:putative methyltransferase NSUN7 [Alosa alosa]|uniref:putative methyltransferase NSUN7 n=1 Tax=Alosa alosa TaxID=278164 RepID=UPI002015366C|nr:putative methyltransferase NSUN7 [Alosa alosa]